MIERHLNPATAIACIALFVALSGAALAAKTTLSKNAVKTKNIAKGAVTTPKLRNGAVRGAKIANEAVGTGQLASGAVRAGQLGGGVVTEAKLKDRAVTGDKIAKSTITDFQLAPDAVGAGKILDGSITATEISEALLKQIVKKVSYASKASESNANAVPKSIFVECPVGKQAIGGGAQVVGSTTGVAITKSIPSVGIEGTATSWSAIAAPIAAEPNPWAVEAFVICAEL